MQRKIIAVGQDVLKANIQLRLLLLLLLLLLKAEEGMNKKRHATQFLPPHGRCSLWNGIGRWLGLSACQTSQRLCVHNRFPSSVGLNPFQSRTEGMVTGAQDGCKDGRPPFLSPDLSQCGLSNVVYLLLCDFCFVACMFIKCECLHAFVFSSDMESMMSRVASTILS